MRRRRKRFVREAAKPAPLREMTGELRMARSGCGYLVDPETGNAVWVPKGDLGTALPGDEVTVRMNPPKRFGRGDGKDGPEARVVRIEKRAERAIVGTVVSCGRFTRVQPLSPAFRQEFIVPGGAKGAEEGDRVVMRLVRWENARLAPEGEIVERIGPAADASLDTLAVMKQCGLPEKFPAGVLAAAEKAGVLPEKDAPCPEGRRDLRKKFIFTCDPAEARDFDDAISIEKDRKGNRVLGVHIADVSHFVRPGTALDREAMKRGTSVYLVDRVVPMLPEHLSNGACSLVPGEDRYAFSVFLTCDAEGRCVKREFAKSVIRSKARYDYEQVTAALRGEKVKGVKAAERKTLAAVWELARQFRERRFADGALDMEVPEAEIRLDADGEMTGIEVRPYDESHQMIEECMVAANEAVADALLSRGVAILSRLHEAPDPEKLRDLRAGLAKLGIDCGDLSERKNLAAFLKSLKGSPLEGVISVMVLKSMKRAVYSGRETGHYGLAKKRYAHFTSPIRRYPDLLLHRQLQNWLAGRGGKIPQAKLDEAARQCSQREQNADDAERSLDEIKKYRWLEKTLEERGGGEFDAVVARCTRYGVFVDLPDLAVGGMVHVSKLSESFLRFDEGAEALVGGGREWTIGTKMRVKVEKVDFDRRMVDFAPLEGGGGGDEPREKHGKNRKNGEKKHGMGKKSGVRGGGRGARRRGR